MLYLEDHGHPRVVSRYGSEKYRVENSVVFQLPQD